MSKRDGAILEILTAEQRIEVTALADRLGVSSVTMRKDLDALQGKGLVQREHGFALLVNPNDVSGRLARHYEEKRRIARKAAVLVPDGSTVMIESGSCCALLARELADVKAGVTIVTNSAFIAGYIRDSARVETVLLGGVAQRDSQVMVGPLVRMCAREFLVNRLFVGWMAGPMASASRMATRCARRPCAPWQSPPRRSSSSRSPTSSGATACRPCALMASPCASSRTRASPRTTAVASAGWGSPSIWRSTQRPRGPHPWPATA